MKFKISRDTNGNKIVKIKTESGGFSIRTLLNTPKIHTMDAGKIDAVVCVDEIKKYVGEFGTDRQKQLIK